MNFVLTLEKIIARISCFTSSVTGWALSSFFIFYLVLEEREIYLQEIIDQSLNERFIIKEKVSTTYQIGQIDCADILTKLILINSYWKEYSIKYT